MRLSSITMMMSSEGAGPGPVDGGLGVDAGGLRVLRVDEDRQGHHPPAEQVEVHARR